MNGKMAKMLRSIDRSSHADKRQLTALDHRAKGILRKNIADMIALHKSLESAPSTGESEIVSEKTVDGV